MEKRSPRREVVSIKVEAELAELLNRLPNKSEFIRKAIAAEIGKSVSCPFCLGRGMVPSLFHQRLVTLLREQGLPSCQGCGNEQTIPSADDHLSQEDRTRLEQYFHGGPLFCTKCYPDKAACDACGWHVGAESLAEHRKVNHDSKDQPKAP